MIKTEYDAFANHYDLEYGQFQGDLDFYVALAREAAPPVLELACGTGRVTLPIARSGVPIVGVDSASEMLARAQEKADSVGRLPVTLVEGDMRTFAIDQAFGLALIPARSFLHLVVPEDHKIALINIRRHLVDGGRLAMNMFVPDLEIIAAQAGRSRGQDLTFSHEFVDPMDQQRIAVWRSQWYDTFRQRIHVRFVYERLDDDGLVISRRHKRYTLCYMFRNEIEHLLNVCGYEVEALYGDFERTAFGPESSEMVWVAHKV